MNEEHVLRIVTRAVVVICMLFGLVQLLALPNDFLLLYHYLAILRSTGAADAFALHEVRTYSLWLVCRFVSLSIDLYVARAHYRMTRGVLAFYGMPSDQQP